MSKEQYTFIDLFAGIGGFYLALRKLGCKCVFASELQSELQDMYYQNFKMKCYGDINQVNIAHDIPKHDILYAGFPCQPPVFRNGTRQIRILRFRRATAGRLTSSARSSVPALSRAVCR